MHGPQFVETRSGNTVENRGATFAIPTQRRASRTFPTKWSSWRHSKFLNPANPIGFIADPDYWDRLLEQEGWPKGPGW